MDTVNLGERLEPGAMFGRYKIVRLIGQGGMGMVFEALHTGLNKRFAIKTLIPTVAQTAEGRARFLREGEAASRILHPNVVAVTDVGTERGIPYIVMECLDGQTLASLLTSRGRMSVVEAVDLMLPVFSAVAFGHDRGVIHRDLKPQNVFLAKGPWGEVIPKVLDFGVSKLVGARDDAVLTGTMTVLGTTAYMSPEQARGARQVDGQSDQYALGLILYEMLTGHRAHPGENSLEILHNVASGVVVPAEVLLPDLATALSAVLTRILDVEADRRYPSLRAAGRDLLPFASAAVRYSVSEAFQEPREGGALWSADAGETTRLEPAVGAVAGGTQLLPASSIISVKDVVAARSASTFKRSAGEVAPRASRRAAVPRRAILGASVVAIGAALAFWLSAGVPEPRPGRADAGRRAVEEDAAPPRAAGGDDRDSGQSPPPSLSVEILADPGEAELVLDGAFTGVGRLRATVVSHSGPHTVVVSAVGYQSQTVSFDADAGPPPEIRLVPVQHHHHNKRRGEPAASPADDAPERYGVNNALIIK